jgi:hypothetical protein
MDWSLTGALAGVTIVAGVVGYGTLTMLGSGPSRPTAPPRPPVLLATPERPAVANVSPIPHRPAAPTHTAIWGDPAPGAGSAPSTSTLQEALSDRIGVYPAPNQYDPPLAVVRQQRRDFQRNPSVHAADSVVDRPEQGRRLREVLQREFPAAEPPAPKAHGSHAPPGSSDSAKRRPAAPQEPVFAGTGPSTPRAEYSNRPGGRMPMDARPTAETSGRRPTPEGQKNTAPTVASQSKEAVHQEQASIEEWKVITTAKANSFNLGGHVDANGIIDSLASPHFRDAVKKHPNYPKLPQRTKMAIEAPNINLAKLAPYRTSLGISDKKIEEEQGIKFVRIASTRGVDLGETRGVDLGELEMANVPALELGPIPAR